MLRHLSRSPPTPRHRIAALLAILLAATRPSPSAGLLGRAAGATLDEVLAIARRLSPELAARALDTEAAQARVDDRRLARRSDAPHHLG